MPPSSSIQLGKLRRHRGLWLLVFVVLLLKLVTGTICLADGARYQWTPSASASASTAMTLAAEGSSLAPGDDACLLGEGSECHCTCVHSIALPTVANHALPLVVPRFVPPLLTASRPPTLPGTLHRPPIA